MALKNYRKAFSRTSEAACRIAVDIILLECLKVMVSRYILSCKLLLDLKTRMNGVMLKKLMFRITRPDP
jgi:hypothetical protein